MPQRGKGKGPLTASQQRKLEKRNKYLDMQRRDSKQMDHHNKHKPFCKFFMEGKCNKVT